MMMMIGSAMTEINASLVYGDVERCSRRLAMNVGALIGHSYSVDKLFGSILPRLMKSDDVRDDCKTVL